MITQKEIARKDFNRVCEINDYEVFTEKQVQGYISHVKGIIQKSEVDNLSEDEVESINTFNEDLPELHKAIVLNDDLSRELVFYRERKVIFEDSIEKSEGIEKAEKIGRYANTHQNRKLGRVGQKFKERSKKAEEEKSETPRSKNVMIDGDDKLDTKTYYRKHGEKSAGGFSLKGWEGKGTDASLLKLDDFDKKWVGDYKLKPDEKIYRYSSDTTKVSGIEPIVKINHKKGLVYFSNGEDNKLSFETKGEPVSYMRLREGEI